MFQNSTQYRKIIQRFRIETHSLFDTAINNLFNDNFKLNYRTQDTEQLRMFFLKPAYRNGNEFIIDQTGTSPHFEGKHPYKIHNIGEIEQLNFETDITHPYVFIKTIFTEIDNLGGKKINMTTLDNVHFINCLYTLLYTVIIITGLVSMDAHNITNLLVAKINSITRENYVIKRCDQEKFDIPNWTYSCGRCIAIVPTPNDINTKILIYDTNNSSDSTCEEMKVIEYTSQQKGGYYAKYLKYKKKYILLRDAKNKILHKQ